MLKFFDLKKENSFFTLNNPLLFPHQFIITTIFQIAKVTLGINISRSFWDYPREIVHPRREEEDLACKGARERVWIRAHSAGTRVIRLILSDWLWAEQNRKWCLVSLSLSLFSCQMARARWARRFHRVLIRHAEGSDRYETSLRANLPNL